jgi:hypothetical protein
VEVFYSRTFGIPEVVSGSVRECSGPDFGHFSLVFTGFLREVMGIYGTFTRVLPSIPGKIP